MNFRWVGSRRSWWFLGFGFRAGRVSVDMVPSAIHRPLFMLDHAREWFAFGWGDGNADPLWMVEVVLRRPVVTDREVTP